MRFFPVFLAAYIVSQFFRSFLAAIAPELKAELQLTDTDLGAISASWFLVFAVAQFPVGWALDRFGPRRTVPTMMAAAVAGALLLAFSNTAMLAIVAMGLIGFGSAPIYMGALFTFARSEPPQRFASLTGLLLALGMAGNLAGSAPLAYAAATVGWRPAFIGVAIATAVIAALWLLVVGDPPALPAAAATAGARPAMLSGYAELWAIRKLRPILPVAFVSYALILAERGLWAGPYLTDVHGLSTIDRGSALLAFASAMAVGSLASGFSDRVIDSRKWFAIGGMALTTLLFIVLGLLPPSAPVAATLLLVGIGGFGMTYSIVMAHARRYLPDHLVGRGLTLVNALFFAGAAVLLPLSGLVMDTMRAAALPVADAFAVLHLSFAGLMVLIIIGYALSATDD